MTIVAKGDRVLARYKGFLEDGTLFGDSDAEGGPIEFVAGGSQEIIAGLTNASIGMEIGQTQKLILSPEDGFGERDPELVRVVSKEHVPDNIGVGDQLALNDEDDEIEGSEEEEQVWTVTQVEDDEVVIDGNHPLAGLNVTIELEVLGINGSADE